MSIVGHQLGNHITVAIQNTILGAEAYHLVGLELDSHLSRHFFGGEVKALASDRSRYRPHQDDAVVFHLPFESLNIDTTHFAGEAIVNTIVDPQRLGDDKVTTDHVDLCALHRRVRQAHGQPGSNIKLQRTGYLLNDLESGFIGDPHALMVGRLNLIVSQGFVYLWPGAIDQYHLDPQAMQQSNIIDDGAKLRLSQRLAPQHHNKCLAPVSIDIGSRMTKTINQFCGTHLGIYLTLVKADIK